MSTHDIPFLNMKKNIILNYSKSAAMGFCLGTQKRVRNIRGKRASSVRAMKVYCILISSDIVQVFIDVLRLCIDVIKFALAFCLCNAICTAIDILFSLHQYLYYSIHVSRAT